MTRQKIGYGLTLIALAALIVYYSAAVFFSYRGNWAQSLLGASVTIVPLLYLAPSAIRREGKAYAALAIIAPLQLFLGGVIWLWGFSIQGAWVCLWAILLQVGTILHSYQRRRKKSQSMAAKQ